MNSSVMLAMGPQPQPGQPQPSIFISLVPLILLFVIFYVALIRPQQKKAKQQAEMLKTIKRGDKIVSTSGIIGIVVSVKEKSVTIKSEDSKMEIIKSAVAEIIDRSGESAES